MKRAEAINMDIKSELESILIRHEGRARAIKAQELAQMMGFTDCEGNGGNRKVRLIIRDLIDKGLPIASSTEAPAGYFLVNNWQEVTQYADSIKGRLIEDAIRRRNFRRAAALYLKPAKQGRLI